MTEGIASWLGHPMTLVLAGLMLALLSATTEILLRSLAELGNVRFQGMLEDHERLLPVKGEEAPHLSRMLDVLRWQQIGAVGLLWLILVRFPGTTGAATMVLCVLTPVVLIILCRALIGPLSEDRTAVLLRLQRPLVWPSVALLAWLAPAPKLPPPEDEEEEASEREIQAYLEAGQAAGIFERDEGEFVESLVDFFDTVVREVMTPRTEMIAVPVEVALDEVMEVISETHKSRIPVYQETVDRVIGVVHVKNLVKQLTSDPQPSLAELAHQCMIVPESKELGELLREFQQHHQQMAIVVDEYGGTSGLVTLEDVLEKIVGEIQDEHEPSQPPEWQELSPGVYRLQGRAPLEVLEELFGVEVDEDDVDTVGGLVFSRHGTVPEAGTEVEDASLGLRFTVDEMRERRIVSVTVRQLEPADDADAEASAE